jgi:two-component system, sensor histidine kinase and response regulator
MGKRILIVDDIPLNIQVLGNILHKHGYEIGYAHNGQQAVERIQLSRFDLILLDIMMPGMNGYETCSHIKQVEGYDDVPVIFISAKTDTDSLVKGFQCGAVDYITKPFNEAELLARVNTHVALRESRETIKESQRRLKIANETKDKFFSIIAHDLLNPVTVVQVVIEGLIDYQQSWTEEKRMSMLHSVLDNMQNITNLLSNLMQWARSHNGSIVCQPSRVQIQPVVQQVVSLLQPTAEKKGIEILQFIPQSSSVIADMNLYMTIVRNIVGNALKFSPIGGKITVRYTETESESILSIRDTGNGIPPDVITKILDPNVFHTTRGTLNEIGTGLGLVICQEFVQLMEGRIIIESEVGQGSVFNICLPKRQTESVE